MSTVQGGGRKEEKKCNRTSWGPGLQSDRINIGNGVERYAAHESAEHNSAADPGTPEPGNIIRSRESILENDWLSVQRGEIEREKRASGFFHCKDFSTCILLLLAWWTKKSRSGDSFIFVRQGRRWQLPRRALWFESERFQMRLWTKRRIWPMEISRKRRKIISGAIQRTTRMLKSSWRMFGLSHGSQQNDRIWRQFFAVLLIEVQLDSGETTVSCQWFIYLCLPLSTGNWSMERTQFDGPQFIALHERRESTEFTSRCNDNWRFGSVEDSGEERRPLH